MSSGFRPAASSARLPATAPSVEELSSGAAQWREWMPVCVKIHSSEEPMPGATSSFVTTRSGR